MTLYVRNLAPSVQDSDLFGIFSKYGPCKVDIKGVFGFITFTDQCHAEKALKETRNRFLYDQELIVERARSKGRRNHTHHTVPRERQTNPIHRPEYPYLDRRHVPRREANWMRHDASYGDLDSPAFEYQERRGKHVSADEEDGCGRVLDVGSDGQKSSDERIRNGSYNTDLNSAGSAGLAPRAGRHIMERGTVRNNDENTDGSPADNWIHSKRGRTSSNDDVNNSQSDSKRKKFKKRHIPVNESLLEVEKNQSVSLNEGEIQSEYQIPISQPFSENSEDSHQSNSQPISNQYEDNSHDVDYTNEESVNLSNLQSNTLSPNNHNQILEDDSLSVVRPSAASIDIETVDRGKRRAKYTVTFDSCEQSGGDAQIDDNFTSAPRLSQGVPTSPANQDVPSGHYAPPTRTLPYKSEDAQKQNDFSLRHADSDGSTPPVSTNMRSTGSYQDDDFVLCESPDREADDLEPILCDLDDDQKDAVKIDHKQSCIVTAGPGSGKTRVFVCRMAYIIIKCGVKPSSILGLTFTNNAATEMKERLDALLGCGEVGVRKRSTRDPVRNLKTIHGFCVQVLREFGDDHGVRKDFVICNDYASSDAIKFLLDEAKTFPKIKLKNYKDIISTIKTERTMKLRKSFDGPTIEKFEEFRRLYDKYLREKNMLDFDDLLLETRRLLRDFPDITASLQNRFQHVFVDETQDTDRIQCDIIRKLCAGDPKLFGVGDPNQSIFGFRGAVPKDFEYIAKADGNTQKKFLSWNYRSSGNIVKVANAVLDETLDGKKHKKKKQNENENDKEKLKVPEDPGKKVRLLCAPNERYEAFFVARDISEMRNSGDISSYSDCAVLARTNRELRFLAKVLNIKGIPYVLSEENSFYGQKEIADILSLLRVLKNPVDDFSVLRIVEVMARKIGKNRMLKIRKHARQSDKTLLNTLEELTSHQPGLRFGLDGAQMQPLQKCVETIQESIGLHKKMRKKPLNTPSANVGSLLRQIFHNTKYRKKVLGRNLPKESVSKRHKNKNVERLIDEASAFNTISEFLDHTALEHTTTKQRDDKSDGVRLLTIHGSKGLEFDTVFVIGANERKLSKRDEHEDRRLLYVAITRAKCSLTLSWRDAKIEEQNSKRKLSRYLQNLPDEAVNNWTS